jgi:hypothetical protein
MKTNREKNTEHDRKELMRVRPKQAVAYDFEPLAKVVRQWVIKNEQT